MNKTYILNLLIVILAGILYPLSGQTPTASFATWKDNKKAAYTIIHDDYSSYVTGIFRDAYPIATARGVKICFGAVTGFCGATEWANARTMIADGHECVNHSHNHKCGGSAGQCTGLNTYSSADFNTELNQSSTLIETNTGVKPLYFIHPYDASSDAIINHLQGTLGYIGSRAGSQDIVNANNFTDFMRENYFVYDGSPAALNSLNTAVNTAISTGGYAIREFHGIDDGSWAAMTKANYTAHLDYVKSKIDDGSIWSCTASEAITYKMQRDVWSMTTTYDATSSTISVNFNQLTAINTAILKTPVTINVNLNGLAGSYDVLQNNAIPIQATRNGDIITFNVYPHQGNITLRCNNCSTTPPVVELDCLTAAYFNNITLTGTPSVVRSETEINNNWATGNPVANISVDNFSVRWEGTIKAPLTGTYTFSVTADDGVRLWVNNVQLINKWIDQSATTYTATIVLTAGQAYPIKMEYYERGGQAVAKLAWTIPGQPSQIVQFSPDCPVTPPVVQVFDPTKCYKLEVRHSKKVMELTSNSSANGIVIQQDTWNGRRHQIWRIKNFDGTHYQLTNGLTGKLATVNNNSQTDGTRIVQWANTGSASQKWQFEKNTEGYYVITAKHSGKVLDIKNASTANMANLIQWTKHGGLNQQWLVSEVACPANTQNLESIQDIVFAGHLENKSAVLQWAVKSSDLTDYYELEKADAAGEFKVLTIVNGNSQEEVRAFSYTDENLSEGDNIYRLKTTMADGTPQLSEVVRIKLEKQDGYLIYPNPTEGDFNIDLSADEGKSVDIVIYNVLGKILLQEHIESATKTPVNLNLSALESNHYFVKIQTVGKKVVMKKLVILK